MLEGVRHLCRQARRRIRADLRTDPYLPSILALAVLLTGFWFWHRIPSFATRDERDRMLDVLVAYGTVVDDPSIESLQAGVTWGPTYGATFYLYTVVLLPVVVVTVLVGNVDVLVAFENPAPAFQYWPIWHRTPEWFWTASLLLVRLTNVGFAVGAVYLTYRIGVATYDRTAGRLAALLLLGTFGFLVLAHEGGEDMPALFFLLFAVYLALRYVQTGARYTYLGGCVAGAVAIGFKLTAAPVVLVLGVAYLRRVWIATDRRAAFVRPGMLVAGLVLGAVVVLLSFPSALVLASPEPLKNRLLGASTGRMDAVTGADAPIWWWFLRNYANGLGLPLLVGSAIGVVASVAGVIGNAFGVREWDVKPGGVLLALTGLVSYIVLFSRWHDFRVHHLLPTFPLLVILLAVSLSAAYRRRPRLARPLIAILLITSGAYAVAGDVGYATQPRDEATAWLDANATSNATLGVSRNDFQDAAIPHDMDVEQLEDGEWPGATAGVCPTYVEVTRRDLLTLRPEFRFGYDPARASYLRDLLAGEYNYELVAEFGSRPPEFVPQRPTPGSMLDLLPVGVIPRSDQYGDEQELGPDQYTAILRRTEPCDRETAN